MPKNQTIEDPRGRFIQEYVHIDADPDVVFRIADSSEEAWRWVPDLISAEIVGGGDKRVGCTVKVRLKLFGLVPMTFFQDVTSYDPPRSVGLRGTGPGMEYDEVFRVAPDGKGAFAGYDIYLKYRGPAKLLGRFADDFNRFIMRKELAKLKAAAEAYPEPPRRR